MRKFLSNIAMFLIGAICCAIVLAIVTRIGFFKSDPVPAPASTQTAANEEAKTNTNSTVALVERATDALSLISKRDYTTLASLVHPDDGVCFSPYATVNKKTDLCFSRDSVAAFGKDTAKYYFGMYDGSGDVINLTVSEYFDKFVYDRDFLSASVIGINSTVRTGNALENIGTEYSDCEYVDFCSETDSNDENWRSLRLVFREYEGELMLVAIIHSQWTT